MPPSDTFRALNYPINIGAGQQAQPTPANPNRRYLLIQNNGANSLEVLFGAKADANTSNLVIAGGASQEWAIKVPTDAIYLYSVAGTVGVIMEGNP